MLEGGRSNDVGLGLHGGRRIDVIMVLGTEDGESADAHMPICPYAHFKWVSWGCILEILEVMCLGACPMRGMAGRTSGGSLGSIGVLSL